MSARIENEMKMLQDQLKRLLKRQDQDNILKPDLTLPGKISSTKSMIEKRELSLTELENKI